MPHLDASALTRIERQLDAHARVADIVALECTNDVETFRLIEVSRARVSGQRHSPRLWPDQGYAISQQLPADALAVMWRVNIEPGKEGFIHSNKTHDLSVEAGDKFTGALKTRGVFEVCCEGNKAARIAGATQLIRSGAVMNGANSRPIFVAIFANEDIACHGFSGNMRGTCSIFHCCAWVGSFGALASSVRIQDPYIGFGRMNQLVSQ